VECLNLYFKGGAVYISLCFERMPESTLFYMNSYKLFNKDLAVTEIWTINKRYAKNLPELVILDFNNYFKGLNDERITEYWELSL
jgi:hypothetical protein|tara:strand:+ start:350 stop:604 length:255 start_codon:yes stop_codon:yes gene_type:complete